MKTVVALTLLSIALLCSAHATSVEPKSLRELVVMADNIWGGTVTAVRMVDGSGRAVTDPEAMTGPGLKNTIFFDVSVDRSLILRSSVPEVPEKISIPLYQMWHYSLGQTREAVEGSTSIFLLTDDMKPAYPAGFQRPMAEEQAIRRLVRRTHGRR